MNAHQRRITNRKKITGGDRMYVNSESVVYNYMYAEKIIMAMDKHGIFDMPEGWTPKIWNDGIQIYP